MDGVITAWWIWPLALFAVSFAIGVVAVLAGVGGGVLFVPIVGGFFPFHLDFVRGAGLLLALSGAAARTSCCRSSGRLAWAIWPSPRLPMARRSPPCRRPDRRRGASTAGSSSFLSAKASDTSTSRPPARPV